MGKDELQKVEVATTFRSSMTRIGVVLLIHAAKYVVYIIFSAI